MGAPGPALLPVLVLAAAAASPADVTVSVDPSADRRLVSPLVFGVNFASRATLSRMGYTVNRWGGNSTTRYSWVDDTSNRASDWFFFNIPEDNPNPGALPDGSAADRLRRRRACGGSGTPAHGADDRLDAAGPRQEVGLLCDEVRRPAADGVHRDRGRLLVRVGRGERATGLGRRLDHRERPRRHLGGRRTDVRHRLDAAPRRPGRRRGATRGSASLPSTTSRPCGTRHTTTSSRAL